MHKHAEGGSGNDAIEGGDHNDKLLGNGGYDNVENTVFDGFSPDGDDSLTGAEIIEFLSTGIVSEDKPDDEADDLDSQDMMMF